MSEVRRYGAEMKKSGTSPMYASVSGQWVHWDTYSALAAQRDEGLAREAVAMKAAELGAVNLNIALDRCDALQQRLAEAERLANALMDEYDNSHRDARPFNAGPLLEQAHSVLASPGCADGEKAG